jgi:DnaD/phage-associated family protein
MSEEQTIVDPSDLRKYRTELPNLYDDSDLDVYEFRLLAHYKRVGTCTESLETTAKKCRMSEGKVSETRQSLSEKGFIKLERVEMDAGRYRFIVQVIDRWIENFAKYSGLNEQDIAIQIKIGSPSPHEGSPSHSEASPSPREGKKELFKKDLVVVVGEKNNFQKYEQEFGALTPMIADAIEDAEKIYPPEWIPEAMQIAVSNNKRNWKYVEGILKNCQAKKIRPSLNKLEVKHGNNGSGDTKRTQSPGPQKAIYSDADREAAERVRKRKAERLAVR